MGLATPSYKKLLTATKTAAKSMKSLPSKEEEGPFTSVMMKQDGESRKDARSQTHLLSTRKTSRIGTWNVRTMFESGKSKQVAEEIKKYTLTILGICEKRKWRWLGHTR